MAYRKILIVDDEPRNLALLGEILKDDYELSFARAGSEALALAASQRPLDNLHQQAGLHFDPALIEVFDACLPGILQIKAEWDSRERTDAAG